MQARGGQPLLAPGPLLRLGQQGLHPLADHVPHRPGPGPGLHLPRGGRLLQVLADRDARQPQLAGDRPLRPPLHQHLVSDNMHLIHPEHPFSEPRIARSGKSAIRPSGGLLSERRLVYFLSGAPRRFTFSFPDVNGTIRTQDDPKFKGKAIVAIVNEEES